MRRFEIADVQAFLRLVDGELPRPCTLVLIGPAALMLGYWPQQTAFDLEVWRASDSVIFTAADRAAERIMRPLRLNQTLAGEPHLSFEDRLQSIDLEGMRQLKVLVPEIHDLAIINSALGNRLFGFVGLHANRPLSLDTLMERYRVMRREVSWPRAHFKESFLRLLTELFGEEEAARSASA